MTGSFNPQPICSSRRDFLRVACRSAAAVAMLGSAQRFCRAADDNKTTRRNIIFILSDDHRYDFMGFMDQVEAMRKQLFDKLEMSGGLDLQVQRPLGERLDQRKNRR